MKKRVVIIFLILLIMTVFTSCSGSKAEDEALGTIIDVRNLKDDQWITINPDETYSLTELADDAMYAIEIKSEDRGALRDSKDNEGFITSGDRTIIVPDNNRGRTAKGSDFGATSSSDRMRVFHIDVANPQGTEGLSIVANESDFTAEACTEWNDDEEDEDLKAYRGYKKEQFYHVNFNTPTYKSLDRSRIFLLVEDLGKNDMGNGNWGLVTLGKGLTKDRYPIMHMYDFSGSQFINIYHEVEFYYTREHWDECKEDSTPINGINRVILINPVSLSYSKGTDMKSGDRVFAMPKAADNDEYVIEVEGLSSGNDLGDVIRLTDKDGYDYCFAYCVKENTANNSKTYFVGKVSEEVFFDVGNYVDLGTIKIRKATAEDKVGFVTLTEASYKFEKDLSFSSTNSNYTLFMPITTANGFTASGLNVTIQLVDGSGNPADVKSHIYTFYSGAVSGTGYSKKIYTKDSSVTHNVGDYQVLRFIKIILKENTEKNVKLSIEIKGNSD